MSKLQKVQIAVPISGTRDGEDWPAVGEFISVPEVEAADLIRSGLARAIGDKAEPEKAVAPKAEVRGGLTKANGV